MPRVYLGLLRTTQEGNVQKAYWNQEGSEAYTDAYHPSWPSFAHYVEEFGRGALRTVAVGDFLILSADLVRT